MKTIKWSHDLELKDFTGIVEYRWGKLWVVNGKAHRENAPALIDNDPNAPRAWICGYYLDNTRYISMKAYYKRLYEIAQARNDEALMVICISHILGSK